MGYSQIIHWKITCDKCGAEVTGEGPVVPRMPDGWYIIGPGYSGNETALKPNTYVCPDCASKWSKEHG